MMKMALSFVSEKFRYRDCGKSVPATVIYETPLLRAIHLTFRGKVQRLPDLNFGVALIQILNPLQPKATNQPRQHYRWFADPGSHNCYTYFSETGAKMIGMRPRISSAGEPLDYRFLEVIQAFEKQNTLVDARELVQQLLS